MKRKVLSLAIVLVLCFLMALTVCAAPANTFVVDEANLLSEIQEEALSARLQQISGTYNAQIVVVTTDDLQGQNIDQYIEFIYDTWQLGYGSSRDGVLMVVAMDVREYRILTNGMADEAIGESGIKVISNAIGYDLSEGNYADAFNSFADECEYYLDGHLNGFPFAAGMNLLIALAVGILVGVVVALILKGQLKSVRKQSQANAYVKPGSMHMTISNDLFLYRTVTRQKRQTSSSGSSGSSGSSRSVGGGSF